METQIENHSTQENNTNLAVIAYITIIGLIIAFMLNKEKKPLVNYHIRQSLGLACCGFALGLLNIIPILGWIISFFGMFVLLFLWIKGLMNAINKVETPVPFLGKKFEEWFKNI
ncbi:hypothetical protein QRD02_06515 [Aequorivita sp. SDUM287046]|uniref:DUF4870 domain-containing protein n=1 Tax=Aequorivita aurantiaca TaxID=3053356 RepID=A0ABT8DH00_9FLAO|nr:hypothetical protein [Aequorivita aurantiaca]MDN3724029.1 hypothetical protein [Aequorivita aurantiaca]